MSIKKMYQSCINIVVGVSRMRKYLKNKEKELGIKPYSLAKKLGIILNTYMKIRDSNIGTSYRLLIAIKDGLKMSDKEFVKAIRDEVDQN